MISDPIILKKIGNKEIYLHKSHKLPEYRKQFPFYDQALPRICKAIKEIDKKLIIVDIGANIGDSVSLITDKVSGTFLCIEGDKKYLPVLKRNIPNFKSSIIEIEPNYCGESNQNSQSLGVENTNGTAKIVLSSKTKTTIDNIKSLDQIINEHPTFNQSNILKIDTDGFEISIIRGSSNFLKTTKPVLYFEFTPEFYIGLKQDPLEIISTLYNNGYESALFYDNFGKPIKIVNLSDQETINTLINKIDKNDIWYYDILTFPASKPEYKNLLIDEILNHSSTASKEIQKLKAEITSVKKREDNISKELYESESELQRILPQVGINFKKSKRYLGKIKKLENKLEKNQQQSSEQINQLQANLLAIQKEKDTLTVTLRNFYASKMWRLMRHYYVLRDCLALRDNQILCKIVLLIRQIKNKYAKKHLRNINTDSNKIIYFDHCFHQKNSKSTMFLVDLLKKSFHVETVWHDSWHGENFPDLSGINHTYTAIIFFQTLPLPEAYCKIKNQNIIFFPMFDGHGYFTQEYWNKYPNLKIINFSKTLHDKLVSWGLDSLYIQYFPKPLSFIRSSISKVFFWQRINRININTIDILLSKSKTSIHLHQHVDPEQTFIIPTKGQKKKYSITFSDWFETRQQMQAKIQQCNIYIAPREYEGIGLGFLEAMAMGKAVIAVNNPTMNEYIVDHQTGYLFDIENPQPINLSNLSKVRDNTYNYMKTGWKKWLTDKSKIIDYIKRP